MIIDLSPATTASTTAILTVGNTTGTISPPENGMPAILPASELYFWSAKWQSQEREFERDRAAGKLLKFDTMDDAIADLMRVDNEDHSS
jgi:hypothetical protein